MTVKIASVLLFAPLLFGQIPHVAEVELYGLRKLPAAEIHKVLKVKPGDPLPASKGDLEEALEEIPGVVAARIEAVCCEGSGAVLFVGVAERGGTHFSVRSAPAGEARLPDDIAAVYTSLMDALRGADRGARALQERLAAFAADNPDLLRKVLRESADESHRAMAGTIIGYAGDKKAFVEDLLHAIQDPDEFVRANAARALTAISAFGVPIPATWLIEMLHSVVLSDRYRAAQALVGLTDKDGAKITGQIRERAWDTVVEMARWRSLAHALPAYILLGRMGGLSETEIQETWSRGDRELVIARLTAAPGSLKKRSARPDRR